MKSELNIQELNSQTPKIWIALSSLLGCGALLGLSTNLSKVAHNQNMLSLPFLTWSLLGATFVLLALSWFKKQAIPRTRASIKYYVIAAFFSVAGANLIFFSAVPHVGVSFVAMTITLPPLLTYIAALLLKMESFHLGRIAAVFFALAGTGLLVSSQWTAPNASHKWILISLIGPVLLAAGNIYRTTHWPKGAKPDALAPGMLLAASALLMIASIAIPQWSLVIAITPENIGLVLLQAAAFAGQFLLLFVLQKAAGPVFLSLIGSVAAVIGIPFAMILLDESVLPQLVPSALLIAIGVVLMITSQKKAKS